MAAGAWWTPRGGCAVALMRPCTRALLLVPISSSAHDPIRVRRLGSPRARAHMRCTAPPGALRFFGGRYTETLVFALRHHASHRAARGAVERGASAGCDVWLYLYGRPWAVVSARCHSEPDLVPVDICMVTLVYYPPKDSHSFILSRRKSTICQSQITLRIR